MNRLDSQFRQKYPVYNTKQQPKQHNKSRWGELIAVTFFVFSLVSNVKTIEAQTWQQTLEQNFDIADTFDELQDWTGSGYGDIIDISDMPKRLDGTQAQWDYYSFWGTPPINQKWIANHGPDNVVGKTGKSLIIDLGNPAVVVDGVTSSLGPSRFGLYFGDGTPSSGYDDIYIFYRVKIPRNYFPQDDKGNFTYAQVNKFFTINMGFTSPGVWNYNPSPNGKCFTDTYSPGGYWPYSPDNFDPNINNSRYKCNYHPLVNILSGLNRWPAIWAEDSGCNYIEFDKWIAFEFRFKRGNTYLDKATVQIWYYSEDGSSKLIYSNSEFTLHFDTCCDGQKWNRFYFGGNNSLSWIWDYTKMVSHYFIDDFIINGTRIGPKYFSLILGTIPLKGDVQCDKAVDILDVQALVNCILGTGSCDWGCGNSADVNKDGSVDVLDVQEVVNIILGT